MNNDLEARVARLEKALSSFAYGMQQPSLPHGVFKTAETLCYNLETPLSAFCDDDLDRPQPVPRADDIMQLDGMTGVHPVKKVDGVFVTSNDMVTVRRDDLERVCGALHNLSEFHFDEIKHDYGRFRDALANRSSREGDKQ